MARYGWLVLLVACTSQNDGATRNTTGAASGEGDVLRVHVADQGNPSVGAQVVYHESEGQLLGTAETDARGNSEFAVAEGGMVTAIVEQSVGHGQTATLRQTIAGVRPGDSLVFGEAEAIPPPTGELTVALPSTFEGAEYFTVDVGCQQATVLPGQESQPLRLTISAECLGSDEAVDILATALDISGQAVAFSSLQTKVENPSANVELPAWRTDFRRVRINLADPPPQSTVVGLQLLHIEDGLPFSGSMQLVETAAFPEEVSYEVADFGKDLRVILVAAYGPIDDVQGMSGYAHQFSANRNSLSIALDDALLPRVSGVRMSVVDGERPQIFWETDGDAERVDGAMLVVTWDEPGGPQPRTESWVFLVPPAEKGELRLPHLPEAMAEHQPSPQAIFRQPSVILIDTDRAAGYEDLRRSLGVEAFAGGLAGGDMTVRASFGGMLPGAGMLTGGAQLE